MDPNSYTRFLKYRIKTAGAGKLHDYSLLSSEKRKNIILWLNNLSKTYNFIENYFEKCISLFDQLVSLQSLQETYVKVIVLALVQLSMKLDHFNDFDDNNLKMLVDHVQCEIPSLKQSDVNMSEIFICNKLNWKFRYINVNDVILFCFTKLKQIFKLINRESLSTKCRRITFYSIVLFNTSEMNIYDLALSIILLALDQLDYAAIDEVFVIKSVAKIIDLFIIDHSVELSNLKWIKNTLADYIISTQEYNIKRCYRDRILNEYNDNIAGNSSCIISSQSYINLLDEYDLQEAAYDEPCSFSEDFNSDIWLKVVLD
jgi:hypothetical protein